MREVDSLAAPVAVVVGRQQSGNHIIELLERHRPRPVSLEVCHEMSCRLFRGVECTLQRSSDMETSWLNT